MKSRSKHNVTEKHAIIVLIMVFLFIILSRFVFPRLMASKFCFYPYLQNEVDTLIVIKSYELSKNMYIVNNDFVIYYSEDLQNVGLKKGYEIEVSKDIDSLTLISNDFEIKSYYPYKYIHSRYEGWNCKLLKNY